MGHVGKSGGQLACRYACGGQTGIGNELPHFCRRPRDYQSGILPDGALQLICGPARTLLDRVDERDVVTFTGSASAGLKLRSHPNLLAHAVPFNMEADSLNSAVLGEHVAPGDRSSNSSLKCVKK